MNDAATVTGLVKADARAFPLLERGSLCSIQPTSIESHLRDLLVDRILAWVVLIGDRMRRHRDGRRGFVNRMCNSRLEAVNGTFTHDCPRHGSGQQPGPCQEESDYSPFGLRGDRDAVRYWNANDAISFARPLGRWVVTVRIAECSSQQAGGNCYQSALAGTGTAVHEGYLDYSEDWRRYDLPRLRIEPRG